MTTIPKRYSPMSIKGLSILFSKLGDGFAEYLMVLQAVRIWVGWTFLCPAAMGSISPRSRTYNVRPIRSARFP